MVSDDPESFADLDGHVARPMNTGDPIAEWNAGIDALGCAGEPESCVDVLEASAEQTEIAAQNEAEQTAGQQQSQTANQQQSQAQQNMSLSQKGLDFIKGYETFSSTVYDASGEKHLGDWTIGYGHKTSQDAAPVTKSEAEGILAEDVQSAVKAVNQGIKVSVSQNQFDALVSLAFNAGPGSVASGHQMMQAVNARSVTSANFTAYRYIHDRSGAPIVSRGLLRRREDEYKMYSEGKY